MEYSPNTREPILMSSTNRRKFLKSTAILTGTLGLGSGLGNASPGDTGKTPKAMAGMTTRKLGRTGARVSILGAGLGSVFTRSNGDPEQAFALLEAALKAGVTFYDTSRNYGPSERLAGPFVKKHRDAVYLVSKSGNRTYDGFKRDLEKSLNLLQTDHIDLYHIHSLTPRDNDLGKIEQGAVKAAREAREQGMIRNFGVTGHSGAAILVKAIKEWDPDAVLTIYPVTRPDRGRYEDDILPLAKERKMGVIAMKCVRHARDADIRGSDLIRYSLSLDGVHTAIVGLDTLAHLKENVAMATNFKPMDQVAQAKMTEDVQLALAGHPAPWDRPGYEDAVAEV
jgi:aryl-alcohol dehydrogenase-like predicted oxidoreductase